MTPLDDNPPNGAPEEKDMFSVEDVLGEDAAGDSTDAFDAPPPVDTSGDMFSVDDILGADDVDESDAGPEPASAPANTSGDMFSVDDILNDESPPPPGPPLAPDTGGDMFSVDDILGPDDAIDAGIAPASPAPLPPPPPIAGGDMFSVDDILNDEPAPPAAPDTPADTGGDMFSVDDMLGSDAAEAAPATPAPLPVSPPPTAGADMFSVDDLVAGEVESAAAFTHDDSVDPIPVPPPQDFFGTGDVDEPEIAMPAEPPGGQYPDDMFGEASDPDADATPDVTADVGPDEPEQVVSEPDSEPDSEPEPAVHEAAAAAVNPFAAPPDPAADRPDAELAQDSAADNPFAAPPAGTNPFAAVPGEEPEAAAANPFAASEEQAENPFSPPPPANPFSDAPDATAGAAFETAANPFESAPAPDPFASEPLVSQPPAEPGSSAQQPAANPFADALPAEPEGQQDEPAISDEPPQDSADDHVTYEPVVQQASEYQAPLAPSEPDAYEEQPAAAHEEQPAAFEEPPAAYAQPPAYGDEPVHGTEQNYEPPTEPEPQVVEERVQSVAPPGWDDTAVSEIIVAGGGKKPKRSGFSGRGKPKDEVMDDPSSQGDASAELTGDPVDEVAGRKVFGISIGGRKKKQSQDLGATPTAESAAIETVPAEPAAAEQALPEPAGVPEPAAAQPATKKPGLLKRLNKPIGKKQHSQDGEDAPDATQPVVSVADPEKKPSLWKRLNKPVGGKGKKAKRGPEAGEDESATTTTPAPEPAGESLAQTYAGGAADEPLAQDPPIIDQGQAPVGIHTSPVTEPEAHALPEPLEIPLDQLEPGQAQTAQTGRGPDAQDARSEPSPAEPASKKPGLWKRLNQPVGKKSKTQAASEASLAEQPPVDQPATEQATAESGQAQEATQEPTAEPAQKKPSLWRRLNQPVGKKDGDSEKRGKAKRGRKSRKDKNEEAGAHTPEPGGAPDAEAAATVAGPAAIEPATPAAAAAAAAAASQTAQTQAQPAVDSSGLPPQFSGVEIPPVAQGFPSAPATSAPVGWSPAAEPVPAAFASATRAMPEAPPSPATDWQSPSHPGAIPINDPAAAFPSLAAPGDLPSPAHGTPASLEKRILALFVDGLVISPLAYLLSGVLGLELLSQAFLGLMAAAIAVYFSLMTFKTNGQTVGKIAAKIRVVSTDGRPIDPEMSVTREAALKILLFGLFGGLATGVAAIACGVLTVANVAAVLRDDDRRALHDRIAHTLVVEDR